MHSNDVSKLFWHTIITNSILFLIVILLVSIISFNTVTDIMYNEMNIANKTILDQTMQNIDSQLKNIDMFVSNLSKDTEFNEYVLNESPEILEKFNVRTAISNAVQKNTMTSNFILFSDVTKKAVSHTSNNSDLLEDIEKLSSQALYENKVGWIETSRPHDGLVFVKPLYNKKGVIILQVNETILYEVISKHRTESKNGILFIVNPSGIVLSHSNKAYIGTNISSEQFASQVLSPKQEVEQYKTVYHNQKTIMFTAKSGYTSWSYVSVIPEIIFTKQISRGKFQIYMISAIIFLISITLAYLIFKKSYKPVDNFVHSLATTVIKSHTSDKIINNFATLGELENALSGLIEDQRVMQSDYKKNAKALSWNIIMNMLLGFDTNYDKFILTLETTNIILYPQNFVVLMLDFNLCGEIKSFKNDEFILIFNILHKKLDDLINQETKGCSCIVGDHSILSIISFENNTEPENVAYAISIANDIIEYSKKNFSYSICISIGNFYENVSGLHKSYNEAVCAMKYKSINQTDSILMIDSYMSNLENNKDFQSLSDIVSSLVKEFKELDETGITNYLNKLQNKMISFNNSIEVCKQFSLQSIMLIVNQYIKPLDVYSHSQISNRYLNSNQVIDSCTDIPSTIENTKKIIIDLSSTYSKSQNINNSQNELASQVISYIDENFMNPLTSLSGTAERFKVSDSHLSRVFKASTGKRFMEYLIYKRIEKAKELLTLSQHKVNDISSLIGYDNQISFMRIFKKYTGVTPSEYRSMYSKQ